MDFVRDTFVADTGFRALTVVDTHTRESPAIEVDVSLPGERVVAVLDAIALDRGYPKGIMVDNGTEFTSRAVTTLGWRRVFEQLLQRGRAGVQYVVSDEHAGLVDAIRRFFPDAVHQRCQVHYLRNALDHVSSDVHREAVKQGLHDVWNAPTLGEAEQRVQALVARGQPTLPKLATWLEASMADTLGAFALRDAVAHRRLRSTNGIEHDHMAVRRRTRVIRVFPNEASFVRLASALAMERNEKWLAKRYVEALENVLNTEVVKLIAA